MSMSDLDKAQECLSISTVLLTQSFISVRAGLDMAGLEVADCIAQSFRKLDRVEEWLSAEGQVTGYRCVYSLGFRLAGNGDDVESDDYEALFEVVASFAALYRTSRALTQAEMEAFTRDNVAFHVWPYWREYLQASASRVGLKTQIEVPLYRVAQGKKVTGSQGLGTEQAAKSRSPE